MLISEQNQCLVYVDATFVTIRSVGLEVNDCMEADPEGVCGGPVGLTLMASAPPGPRKALTINCSWDVSVSCLILHHDHTHNELHFLCDFYWIEICCDLFW